MGLRVCGTLIYESTHGSASSVTLGSALVAAGGCGGHCRAARPRNLSECVWMRWLQALSCLWFHSLAPQCHVCVLLLDTVLMG